MNKQAEFIVVSQQDDGIRLDKWIKQHYPSITFGLLQKLLRKNAIKIDGKKAKADIRLCAGQKIRVPYVEPQEISALPDARPQATYEQAKELLIDNIIFSNKHLVAINKPPGLPVQGGSKVTLCVDDMLPYLADYLASDKEVGANKSPHIEKLRLIHRIDKDTSGVLMFARTLKIASAAGQEFKDRGFHKTYWALIVGVPEIYEGEIDLPLTQIVGAGNIEKTVVCDNPKDGKRSITHYKVIEKLSGSLSWVALKPITGRKHQLRAHLQAIGHPIVGDGKYGGAEAFIDGLSKKMHLHARTIHHPSFMDEELNLIATLPRHMLESWKLFEFDANNKTDYFAEE